MALTRILCGPPSPAITLVSAMPAARDTEVGVEAGGGALARGIEHVDDAAPFALFHARPHQPAEADRGKQFEVEILLPHLVGHRFERHRARRAGIVDENVDLAEIPDDLLKGRGNIRRLGDVADIVANRKAILGQRIARRRQVFGAARHDRDPGAGFGKSPRHREPDTLAAAGNDGDAIIHGDIHFVFSRRAFIGGSLLAAVLSVRRSQNRCRGRKIENSSLHSATPRRR